MRFQKTKFDKVFIVEPKLFYDERGVFVKTFHELTFKEWGLETNFRESFYSESRRNVIRGMHFQLPPHDHAKLVYVPAGKILDVVVDIRRNSSTYGDFLAVELSGENRRLVYIPAGFAHGFAGLSESSLVIYSTTTVHHPEADSGIRWDSFGCDWGIADPIVSPRDRAFKKLTELDSPFR